MPIHDWTQVKPGIFHDFHHEWISAIKRALNRGLLPTGYYAMAEQVAGGLGPDVLTLEAPSPWPPAPEPTNSEGEGEAGGVAVAKSPPKVRFHRVLDEAAAYAKRAKAVVVRHSSDHRVVAVVELVSPGNKASQYALASFVEKVRELLASGIHLLILDLFPPGPRDPEGLHRVIWEGGLDAEIALPADEPLSCMAYTGGLIPEVFLEPVAVGKPLPEMPLFLSPRVYVPVPLEATYQDAFNAVPAYWRDVLASSATPT